MNIKTRRVSEKYIDVTVAYTGTTMEAELLNRAEQEELANDMINAIIDMGPRDDWDIWFANMLNDLGIGCECKGNLVLPMKEDGE